MLDNKNYINQYDTQGALDLAAHSPEQLAHAFDVKVENPGQIDAVVFSAMGGSALQAEFARTWPKLQVPFIVSKDYSLPSFVNERTLVIVASYSGNTEETLSALAEAREKGATIAIMTGGGKLLEQATQHGDTHVVIPKAIQPRMAVFYAFRGLVELFVGYGLVDKSVLTELEQLVAPLEAEVAKWVKSVPTHDNPAKQLAEKMVGKTPIIYSGSAMSPAAYKWKISVNENAKNTAWSNTLPEFNHNEFMGWSSHPVEKPFVVIDLLSSFEHHRVLKRFEVSNRLLSGMRPDSISVAAQGDNALAHLLYLVIFGDFVTLYMGILNGVDPSPVELVEKFKVELDK